MPERVVVVLLDSLNRHLLGAYGSTEFDTPNLDAFAASSVRFTRHVTGSLPCMPARHDLLVGALDFLWRPWGSIELWEAPITAALRERDVVTMLVTDHPHLFETGGENYHTDFFAWDYVRGHEGDAWRTCADPSFVGTPAVTASWYYERVLGRPLAIDRGYDRTRSWLRDEDDYPGPRVMRAAADWLRRCAPADDPFLLVIDEFDPHEPFDTPEPWRSRYSTWDGPDLIWPPYANGAVTAGRLTPAEAARLRANYGAKLSMIDHWLGLVLDAVDDDTAVIVTTDHGHYLGDVRGGRDLWGKPAVPQYAPLGCIPLLVRWPGRAPGVCDALTTTVDLHATLAHVFGVEPSHRTHGRSLVPLLDGTSSSIREWALGGVWGGWVHVTDGHRRYSRAPADGNRPLSMWSNRWSTMPLHVRGMTGLPAPDQRAVLDRMPGSEIPVIRQPFAPGDLVPFWANDASAGQHHLYDIDEDPDERENLAGHVMERDMIELLVAALDDVDAPAEQRVRLGV